MALLALTATGYPQEQAQKLDLVIKGGSFADVGGQNKKATIGNLADFAREKFHQNIVMSPGVSATMIDDLTIRSADIQSFFQAVMVTTGMAIDAHPIGEGTWAVMARPRPGRRVEVFNLSGYLENVNRGADDKSLRMGENLARLQQIISETYAGLTKGRMAGEEQPNFQFHPGANLFIVIGAEELIEVARKVITALPGQQGPQPFGLVPRSPHVAMPPEAGGEDPLRDGPRSPAPQAPPRRVPTPRAPQAPGPSPPPAPDVPR